MSRKSMLLAAGILVLLSVGIVATLFFLVRHEPAYYRRGALAPGAARKKQSKALEGQVSQLISAFSDVREWSAQFTDEQINSYFVEDFRTSGLEERILPKDINEPRVQIEADRVRLGFRYGSGLWSTIITIDVRVWVARGEPNVVGLELKGMRAGALPISAQSLLEYVSEAARRQNVEVSWYRFEGNPVAVLRFQGKRSRTTVQLQQLDLQPGKLMLKGRSVDPVPTRAGVPAASE